jgi:Amt family ammonium transporter
VTTTLSGAAGALTQLIFGFAFKKAWNVVDCCNGALVGFVTVTCCAHVIEPWAAIICGAVASVVFEFVCVMFLRLKIDDPLSAAPMHGFCGAWGLFWVGLMAKQEYILQVYGGSHTGTEANAPVPNADDVLNYPYGLFYYGGGGLLLASQIIGILVIFAWVTVNMVPFYYVFKFFGALRISAEEEQAGRKRGVREG